MTWYVYYFAFKIQLLILITRDGNSHAFRQMYASRVKITYFMTHTRLQVSQNSALSRLNIGMLLWMREVVLKMTSLIKATFTHCD